MCCMTMSQTEKETNASSPETDEQVCKNVASRVANLQLVSSTYEMVSSTYATTKDDHPVVKSVFDMAEKGIKTVATAAADGVQPILSMLEPQIAVVNEYACQGLDKLEEKLPILQQPVDKVISGTKELLSTTVAGAKDAIYNTVAEAQNAVTGMVDMVKETVQGSVAATKSLVTSSVSTVMGVACRIEQMLEKPEECPDNHLPITEEELAKLAAPFEGFEAISVEQQKLRRRYYVHLGALPTKVLQCAYQQSLAKIKHISQLTKEYLSQLQETLDLSEHCKQMENQKLDNVRGKLGQKWLQWSAQHLRMSVEAGLPKLEEMESRLLLVLRRNLEQVRDFYIFLGYSIQGLPSSVQDQTRQVQKNIDDLYVYFSALASFQDASSSMFCQGKAQVSNAQESLDTLLDYLSHNVPLLWLVGPFVPSGEPAEVFK
ncbi:hypothetical protein lerEdw1_002841 [Lerista edwardsae]|nr:hypothetical protein lerEdw1_002841 [Lerista edwardsae]